MPPRMSAGNATRERRAEIEREAKDRAAAILIETAEAAAAKLRELLENGPEPVQLGAPVDILDRLLGKTVERHEDVARRAPNSCVPMSTHAARGPGSRGAHPPPAGDGDNEQSTSVTPRTRETQAPAPPIASGGNSCHPHTAGSGQVSLARLFPGRLGPGWARHGRRSRSPPKPPSARRPRSRVHLVRSAARAWQQWQHRRSLNRE